MPCPVCGNKLEKIPQYKGVTVYRCSGCGGQFEEDERIGGRYEGT